MIAQPEPKHFKVQTPDGVVISAQEWGNANGLEILLIHGFSQSHLSWSRQFGSELANSFRIVTYDLRGHGASAKPLDAAYYRDHKRWADELQAVIDAANLKRPVLVGWSYGGRIIVEYLMEYGDKNIAGINFVGAFTKVVPELLGPATPVVMKMASENLAENIASTRSFLRFSTAKALPPDELESMLAYNMVVPPKVRRYLLRRPAAYETTLLKDHGTGPRHPRRGRPGSACSHGRLHGHGCSRMLGHHYMKVSGTCRFGKRAAIQPRACRFRKPNPIDASPFAHNKPNHVSVYTSNGMGLSSVT